MEKLCIFFVIALISSEAMCMSFKHKRQVNQEEGGLEDRYGWDTPNRPWGIPGFPNFPFPQFPESEQQQQTTTPATNNGGPTTASPATQQCIRDCQVTSEYNPVCGTNNVTYNNPGRLLCAKNCGLNVSLLRSSPCPPASS